jgi:hypothetical protein
MNKNIYKPKVSINVIRILNVFIRYPTKEFTFYDLLGVEGSPREKTGGYRISEALDYLVDRRIIRKTRPLGAPPKAKQKKKSYGKKYHYRLSHTNYAFKQVFDVYLSDDINKLLSSEYTNNVIGEIEFERIYKIIGKHLADSDFRRKASQLLLYHQATKGEYWEFANELQKKIIELPQQESTNTSKNEDIELSAYLSELGEEISPKPIGPIELLKSFEPVNAVRFYREILHQSLRNAYDELARESIISNGLRNFLVFDNYLSPFTAHPSNSVVKIIFSQPFQRIYEDAYLIDKEKFWVLSARAVAIYNYFSDFLLEYFKYVDANQEEREIIAKEMIYLWNVASTRFDLVCYYLAGLYEEEKGSGDYHLISDGLTFNVIDLVEKKPLLSSEISSSILMFGSTPQIFTREGSRTKGKLMSEPFTRLRPCLTFEDMGWKSEYIPFDEILSELDSKLAEYRMEKENIND